VITLSVNVNKIATLRNSRGGELPCPIEAAAVCIESGAGGITVHARADARHIRPSDVRAIAGLVAARPGIELNVEGDPRPDWLELVHEVRPHQATLVPVRPGELTSEAGWPEDTDPAFMQRTVAELKAAGIRTSLFVDARENAVEWAARMGADRVELYTGHFAQAMASSADRGRADFARHVSAATRAHALGLGVNAGHDLDLDNLLLYRTLPHLSEVSIGHALIGRAVFHGLAKVVREYVELLRG
jgi:pyridoxine 5-phosphate synthase